MTKFERQFKAAQARYDAMEPEDDGRPCVEEVDEEFRYFHCYMCDQVRGDEVEPIQFQGYTKHYCGVCGREVMETDEYDWEALKQHMAELRNEAVAEYGEARVKEIEREREQRRWQ